MLQQIVVKSFSIQQIISFCSQKLEGWNNEKIKFSSISEIAEFLKYRFDGVVPDSVQVVDYLSNGFPGSHYFQGDEYIPAKIGTRKSSKNIKLSAVSPS